MSALASIAQQLVAPSKGILAADESFGNIEKKFQAIGIESTEQTRQAYRELLFTTPELEKYISGVILFDETIRQKTSDGVPFVDALKQKGMLPGIKVDEGLEDFGELGEKVTKGLGGLAERLAEYATMGAVFTKWRAVFTIGSGTPSEEVIAENTKRLAEFASLSQLAGLVPVVEPEVLMDGDHAIIACREVTEKVLTELFVALKEKHVDLFGLLLKPNMVLPGSTAKDKSSDTEIAKHTLIALRNTVPTSVPGIVFLSGGQSPEEATQRLAAISMSAKGTVPWQVSFSFGRALQAPVLAAWQGKPENVKTAQEALLARAEANSVARG